MSTHRRLNEDSYPPRFDQCHWLQQQLRVFKGIQDIRSQYNTQLLPTDLSNFTADVQVIQTRLLSAITSTYYLLRETKPKEAMVLSHILANVCQPSQTVWSSYSLFAKPAHIDLIIEQINDLYIMGAVGLAKSMQETLVTNLIRNDFHNNVTVEREIEKLVKFNNEFSKKVPQILTKLGIKPNAFLTSTPPLQR